MTEEFPRRRSLGFHLFKSKASKPRKDSADSTYSSNSSIADTRGSVDEGRLRRKLRKGSAPNPSTAAPVKSGPFLATSKELKAAEVGQHRKKQQDDYPAIDISQAYQRNKQTGEQQIDHTDLLHSLVHQESAEDLPQFVYQSKDGSDAQPGHTVASKLPEKLWPQVLSHLDLADIVSLSFSCKAFREELQPYESSLHAPDNQEQKAAFLLRLDNTLPHHLFCFNCNKYHRRLQPGRESLKPTNVANPVFTCPHSSNPSKRITRVRITSGRTLPYTYVQLALRAHHFGFPYGISLDILSRRYKEANASLNNNVLWSHQTRYCIVNNHLLVRVISTTFAAAGLPPAGLRNLLYNPGEEFHPYFSTCPHWRDGLLMPLVKCAIGHIPAPPSGGGIDRVGQNIKHRLAHHSPLVTLCSECRPMRRCPQCPTEYLIEVKMSEDKTEIDPTKTFKQALMVTRWSDLGDGTVPYPSSKLKYSKDWAAVTDQLSEFDSFQVLGRRAISGIFESHFNVDLIPGQRILNLNPDDQRKGEEGHDWY